MIKRILWFLPLVVMAGCGQITPLLEQVTKAPVEEETSVVVGAPLSAVDIELLLEESLASETPLDRDGNPANPEAVKIYSDCQRNKKEFVGRGSRFDVPGKNYTDEEIARFLDIPVGCLTR